MANPGPKVPPSRAPKGGDYGTKLPLASGAKTIKCDHLDFGSGQPADLKSANGPTAPTSRVYTRDYKKNGRSPGDEDLITDALGRSPFRI